MDTGAPLRRGVPMPEFRLKQAYVAAVWQAGGMPILAPPMSPSSDPSPEAELDAFTEALLETCDGVLLSGGDFDIPPEAYGEVQGQGEREAKPLRTQFEAQLFHGAMARKLPVLGICGGMQLINVLLGGTLYADLRRQFPGALEHEQPNSPMEPGHALILEPSSPLFALLGAEAQVNSTHHQAVCRLGSGLEAWAHAPDGVIEAIGLSHGFVWGIQGHPELLSELRGPIYAAFVAAARSQAAKI